MSSKKGLNAPNQEQLSLQSTAYGSSHLSSQQLSNAGEQRSLDSLQLAASRRFLQGGAQIGGGSYNEYELDHIARMHDDIEQTTRRLELAHRRLSKVEKELSAAESEYAEKRKKYKLNQAPQDDILAVKANGKRLLERRLEKAIADLNKGTCENKELRSQIDQLRRERQTFDAVFKQLENAIAKSRKQIDHARVAGAEHSSAREEAKQKTQSLEKMLDRERRDFQYVCEEFTQEVGKQNEILQLSMMAEKGVTPEKGSHKGKHRREYMKANEEESFSEEHMHRRILKLAFLNTIQRRHIKEHQKNIEVFEQAFATITSSTGISDIEEIVKIFIGLEQRNFSLLTYVNQLNREIESVELRNRHLRDQEANYEKQQTNSEARKDAALVELRQQIEKIHGATNDKNTMIEESAAAMAECKPLIWNTVSFLRDAMPELLDQAYDGSAPPQKAQPPEEHDDDLNAFLMYIEQAVMQFRASLDYEQVLQSQMPQPKPGAPGARRVNDLPATNNPGDDTDDEPESGLNERPLTRTELRDRAAANISRRRKKGVGLTGKAHAEDVGAESVRSQPLGSAMVPREETPLKSPTGSSRPVMDFKDFQEEEAPDRKGPYRDKMPWRGQGEEKRK